MRSDFVGSCSQYPKLTQAINQSQFLIPYMTLEEKREAITGPIEIAGGKIEDSLVDKILQDVGNKPDQLPIMQHALMRTWNQWQAKGDVAMSLGHYTDIGGMEKALSQHANEAFMSLEENQREMCGKVFRTITEITAEGNRVRRPTKLAQIAVITGEPIDEISQIVQAFRRSDRGLLMPPESEALTESSIIDISHESLLRIWGMLAEWVREEAESVEMYLRLAVDAERQQQGGTGHWQGLDLELGQRWQRTQKPTKEWGLRYHPTYERTILFLETSIGKAKQAIQDRENAQQRKQQRNRVAMIGLVATLVIFGILTFVAWFQSETARRAQKKATENAALAESKRKEAEKNLQEADRQRDKAKKEQDKAYFERQRAEKAQLKAEEEQRLAEINKKIAEEQAVIASNARDNALKQQRLAELAGKRAKIQAEIAQISAELAQLQEAETRRAKAETERLQLLALARSMAIKSKQIDESNVKGQIARQAYNFYQTAKETHQDNDPDIYTGLYYTLKELKGDDYNKLISHQANVRALVQGNGSEVYSAGADGKIIHWNTQSNQATDSAKKSTVHRTLSISPNKKILACAGNYPYIELLNANQLSNTIQKINLQIGRQVWFVGFMNDNTLISVEDDGKLILWNLQGNKADSVKTKQLEGKITAVAVHNQKIVVAGNKGVRLLSIPSLEESIFNSATGILSIAFNKAGTKIAMGDMQSLVKVYSTATKQQLGENLKGHKARVNTLCFNDDDTQLASASFDNTVRVWNIEPGKYDSPPIILDDHRDWVWSVCFSTDKRRILAGCRDNVVRLWATQINEMATEVCTKIKDDISPKDWKRFVGESIRKVESVCK
jgi:WD40 repeat protein